MNQKEKLAEGQKLIKALYELSKDNFSVSDDTILDKLYVHVEKAAEYEFLDPLLSDFSAWIEYVLKQWNDNTLCAGVKVFSIRLIGFIGHKPETFTTIKPILPEIEKLILSSDVHDDSSFMVPMLNDLALFLNHEEGVDWVLQTGIWKHAVKAFFEDRSIYINRSGVKLISLLICKVYNYNYHKVIEILNAIGKPLIDSCLLTIKPLPNQEVHDISMIKKDTGTKSVISGKEVDVKKLMTRSIKFLYNILEELSLSGTNLCVLLDIKLETDMNALNFSSPQDLLIFLQVLVMLEFCDTSQKQETQVDWFFTPHCAIGVYHTVYWASCTLMKQGHWTSLMDFCVFCLSKIHYFRGTFPHLQCGNCSALESMLVDQLKMFLKLHCRCYSSGPSHSWTLLAAESGEESGFDIDGDVLKKLNEIKSSEDLSFQCFQLGIFATIRSVNFITSAANREAISTVVLNSFATVMKHLKTEKGILKSCLLHLITLVNKIVESYPVQKKYRIYYQTKEILDNEEIEEDDPRITIKTLQLLKKIIHVQILPKLLEFDTLKPKPTPLQIRLENVFDLSEEVKPFFDLSLKKHLENNLSWEIRDTTLEVYQLLVELADIISLLSVNRIFNDHLYIQIWKLAAQDGVAYVRSSALTFFGKALRSKIFLDKLLDLSDFAVKTLLEDEMPEPRMAACDLLGAIYVTIPECMARHGNIPGVLDMEKKLYEAVYIASMKELDWEVKKATLRFWKCTITKSLADEKVPIDPVLLRFPFVATTKDDVVMKIIKVMDTLSDIGCLKVIWLDVNDDSDISVAQEACQIIDDIEVLDKSWSFIDIIINNLDMEVEEENLTNKKLRTKDFFIYIRQKDWRDRLEARKNWIENTSDDLSSLLDHILNPENTLSDMDHNVLDCY